MARSINEDADEEGRDHLKARDALADALADDGYQWLLIFEGPIEGEMWQVAISVGGDVPPEPVTA